MMLHESGRDVRWQGDGNHEHADDDDIRGAIEQMRAEERGRRVNRAPEDVEDDVADHGTMRRNDHYAGEVEVEPSHHALRELLVTHFNYKKTHHQLEWLS